MKYSALIAPPAALVLFLFSMTASAAWKLDDKASSLAFVSIKNGMAVESHEFKKLKGTLTEKGHATLVIDLDSVETMIPIRNERMREMLFETSNHPEATVKVDLDTAAITQLQAGQSLQQTIAGQLSLHGQTATVMVPVVILRTATGAIVTSQKPVIINAADWNLSKGLGLLREVAGLSSITPAVPVSFTLKFDKVERK